MKKEKTDKETGNHDLQHFLRLAKAQVSSRLKATNSLRLNILNELLAEQLPQSVEHKNEQRDC
jgi:hypothetical protein